MHSATQNTGMVADVVRNPKILVAYKQKDGLIQRGDSLRSSINGNEPIFD